MGLTLEVHLHRKHHFYLDKYFYLVAGAKSDGLYRDGGLQDPSSRRQLWAAGSLESEYEPDFSHMSWLAPQVGSQEPWLL